MRSVNTSNACLVCFVGIDGAGKSTLALSLKAAAEHEGIRCRYAWGGFTSSFTLLKPMVAVAQASVFRGDNHMTTSRTKGRVLKNRRLSAIYQYLALVDYLPRVSFTIGLPRALGWNVICDRYIYDLVTSIGVHLDYPPESTLSLLRRCLALVPKPDLVFLLDLPEALAYQRKDDIVSLDFLSVRRNIYLRMAEEHGMTVLDASRGRSELEEVVAATVLPQMRRDGQR